MADRGARELFRKKSLERLSSPERLDQLLEVVDRRSWLPLTAIASLLLGTVVWSVLGRIPIHVEGRGMLVRPRKVVEFQSPGPGRVSSLEVEIGDEVQRGQVLAMIQRPDLEEQLRLQKQKAAELTRQSLSSTDEPPADASAAATRASGPSLRDHIERSRAHARRLHEERIAALESEERRLDEQETVARELADSLRERLEGQRRLFDERLIAKSDLDGVEEELMNSLERLYDLETQRGSLRTSRLEADERYYDRLQTIAEWSFELEQQIADVHREIARIEAQLAEESRVVSDHRGRILELSVSVGAFLGQRDRIGAMEVTDRSTALQSITYFQVKDGKRLAEEMPIQITPDTVERERYGSIKGVVRSVSSFPVSLEEAVSVVGNRTVAQSLIDAGYLIAVSADLERSADEPDRYAWTSSRGPEEVDVTAGTTTTARVAVKSERPIAFVIPLLKTAAGID